MKSVNYSVISFFWGGQSLEKQLRRIIPKLALYNFKSVVKCYEKYALIRYRKHFDEILNFRNSYFVIGKDVTLFPSVYLGIYEEKELDILLSLEFPKDLIFWDVGANVGIYSVIFGKKFPAGRVIAFEPNLVLHSKMIKNLKLNDVKNVTIEKSGLSNIEGWAQLEEQRGRAGAGKISSISSEYFESKSIRLISGDMYAKDFPKLIPHFIKIDVEGHEPEVIEGLSNVLNQFKPVLMIEIFSNLWESERKDAWRRTIMNLFSLYSQAVLISDGIDIKIRKWDMKFLNGSMQTLIFYSDMSLL